MIFYLLQMGKKSLKKRKMVTEFIKTFFQAPLFKRLTLTVTHTAPYSVLVRGVKQTPFALLPQHILGFGYKEIPT